MKFYQSIQVAAMVLLFASVSHAIPVVISGGKPVTASGYYTTYYPSQLTDGNYSTCWIPPDYSGWAEIDLQESTRISQVIYYAWATPESYESLVLYIDGTYMGTVNLTVPYAQVTPVTIDFNDYVGRYVRIVGTATSSWFGGMEMEVCVDRSQEWAYLYSSKDTFTEDWLVNDVDILYSFWSSAQQGEFIEIDGEKWYYLDDDDDVFSGHAVGDYWTDTSGNKFVYLNGGLSTKDPTQVPVPEPASILLLTAGVTALFRRLRRQ